MIHVIAVLSAKPGSREAMLEAFRANLPAVRAEKGCIEYCAVVDAESAPPIQAKYGADAVVVIEKWENMDAFKAHVTAPHMAAHSAKIRDLVASRTIHVLAAC